MNTYSQERLRELLLEIDEEVELEVGLGKRHSVVIVGGAAFMLADLTGRKATHDVDVLRADEAIQGALARHRQLNTQVQVYADRLPKGFEGRLVRIPLETTAVDFFRPSAEDLAVMKLYSWRRQDQIDLTSPKMLAELDPDLLERIIYDENEAKASSLTSLTYRKMVEVYEREYKPKATKLTKRSVSKRGRKS